jgi:hypothetical protein
MLCMPAALHRAALLHGARSYPVTSNLRSCSSDPGPTHACCFQATTLCSNLAKAGLKAMVHVAGSIVTGNPIGLIQVSQDGTRCFTHVNMWEGDCFLIAAV